MAWQIKRRKRGVEVVMRGRIPSVELNEANEAAYAALPDGTPRFAVFDLTAVEVLDVSLTEIRAIAAADLAVSKRFPDLLTVIVAPKAVNFGIARQWQLLADQLKSRVVADRALAAAVLVQAGFDATDSALGEATEPQ